MPKLEQERQEKCVEIIHQVAIVYDVTLKEISEKVARQVYDIVIRLEPLNTLKPNK